MNLRSGKTSVFDYDLHRSRISVVYDDSNDITDNNTEIPVLNDDSNDILYNSAEIPVLSDNSDDNLHNSTEISVLNDHCLMHIFSYLPIMDRIRIQLVNKRWKKVSELKWHDTKILDLNLNKWSAKPSIDTVMITSREIEKIIQLCGNFLTTINFGQDTNFQNSIQRQLHIIADKKFFSIIIENCTNLLSLNVSGIVVKSSGMEILANNCSNIKEFSIGNCIDDVTENFSKFLKNARKLQFLGLSGADITSKCFVNTWTTSIEVLKLYKFHDYSKGRSFSEAFFFKKIMHGFSNLNTLIIENCCLSQDDMCKQIVSNTRNLKKLVLKCDYECSNFYHFRTKYIWGLRHLQEVEFAGIKTIGDDVILGIAKNCKELQRVILHSLPLTDSSIKKLLQLPKLDYFEVRSIEKITDHAFVEAVNLKTLVIYYCDRVENKYLYELLVTTVKMETLHIHCCARIDADDLVKFAASEITWKRLNGCCLNIYIKDKPLFVHDYYKSEEKVKQISPYLRVTNLNK